MAVCQISFKSLIICCALIYHVSGTNQTFLSVPAAQKYLVEGKTLKLSCKIHGRPLFDSRVSWKHNGEWLHNQTKQEVGAVKLILPKVMRHQEGIYQCGVYNLSGLSPSEAIPADANVTLFVGGAIKAECNSSDLTSPNFKDLLHWNALVDHQGVQRPFTYQIFYCYLDCYQPSRYNVFRGCPIAPKSSAGMVMECNLTSLYMKVFPKLFSDEVNIPDLQIYLAIGIANMDDKIIGKKVRCTVYHPVKCTKPANISLDKSATQVTLIWDPPKDVEQAYRRNLIYWIRVVTGSRHGDSNPKLIKVMAKNYASETIRRNIGGLHPHTRYDIYISCSIMNIVASNATRGEEMGPFPVTTREEAPSSYPKFLENATNTRLYGQYRDVTLHWELPDSGSWNGNITRFELRYWIANSNVTEVNIPRVIVLSNVSMTAGTLKQLRQDEVYKVTAKMCTSVNCGPPSQPIFIPRLDYADGTHVPRTKEQGNKYYIIGVVLGLLLCVGCLTVMGSYWYRRRRGEGVPPLKHVLGKLPPPRLISCESDTGSEKREDSHYYDVTTSPLLSGDKNEYVQIKTPEPAPNTLMRLEHDTVDI